MATSNSDGSIVLSTKVDTSGVDRGVKETKAGLSSLNSVVAKLGAAMAAAFGVKAIINFGKEAINLASDLQEVQNVVDTAFGDMSYKIEDFSKKSIETFGLSELTAKQWASTMMAMGSGMGQSMEAGSDMAVELTGRLADVMSFYNKTEEEAFTLGKAIYSGETEPLKNIGIVMTENNLSLFAMSKGYQQAYKDMDAANKLLVRQQFFLEQTSLAAGDYTKTSDGWANQTRTLSQRWKEMQAVFGETLMSLGVLVLPIINDIIDGLKQLAVMLRAAAMSFGLFKEETSEADTNIENQAQNSKQTAENIKDETKQQKKLNKEMKKSLAGFDEIQTLSEQAAENIGDVADQGSAETLASVGQAGASMDGSSYVSEIESNMLHIMDVIGVSLAAVGLILLFKGKIGWGIGFLIVGAAFWSISEIWGEEDDLSNASVVVENIMQTIGVSLAAVGLILLTRGIWAWGIGFIIVGAAIWSIGEIWGDENFDPNEPKQVLEKIMETIEVSLMAIGIILLLRGLWQWGLGFLVAGAIVWGVKEIVANWDDIVAKVEQVFKDFGGIIAAAGAALIVLGIILCCTPVGFGLGIGLIVAGAAAVTGAVAANWDVIVDWVKGAWEAIKGFWNTYIAPIFTLKWWLDLAKACGNGLIAGFEAAVNGIIWLFESMVNFVVDALNLLIGGISSVSGAIGDLIGVDLRIPKIPKADLGEVKIPRLAQGAVIPPNKEFLAVLGDQKQGTNIEAPLDTIKQALYDVIEQVGLSSGESTIVVPLYLNGKEIARAVREAERNMGTQTVVGGFANAY